VLTTQITDDGDCLRVRLAGEIDADTGVLLQDAIARLDAPRHQSIELDLSAVTFMDSSGIAALVQARRVADRAGVRVVLVDPSHPVVRVLALVGLEGFFAVA